MWNVLKRCFIFYLYFISSNLSEFHSMSNLIIQNEVIMSVECVCEKKLNE